MTPAFFPSILPVCQQQLNDCAIASIATLTSTPYSDIAHLRAATLSPDGLFQHQIVEILKRLGYRCTNRRRFDLHEDVGILTTVYPKSQHVVVLWNGIIYDPDDGLLWEADVFLTAEKVRASVLTVLWRK